MGKVSVRYIVTDMGAAIPFYTTMLGFRVDKNPAPGALGAAAPALLISASRRSFEGRLQRRAGAN